MLSLGVLGGADILGWVVTTSIWTDVSKALAPAAKTYAGLGGVGALEGALLTLLVFVVLRLVLRRTWLTLAVGIILMTLASAAGLGGAGTPWAWLFPLARGSLLTFVVVRRGLLATIATLYFSNAVTNLPLRLDFSHWAGTPSLWALTLFIGLTFFAFSAARAGQPLFGAVLKD